MICSYNVKEMRNTKNNSVLEVEDKSTEMTEIGVEETREIIQSVAGSVGRRGGMNKYVLGTSLLASTNSLLLGYGELINFSEFYPHSALVLY